MKCKRCVENEAWICTDCLQSVSDGKAMLAVSEALDIQEKNANLIPYDI